VCVQCSVQAQACGEGRGNSTKAVWGSAAKYGRQCGARSACRVRQVRGSVWCGAVWRRCAGWYGAPGIKRRTSARWVLAGVGARHRPVRR